MSKYVERAEELFCGGCNCAQSIVGAYSKFVGLDENKGIAAAALFGAGLAGMRGPCGAVSGALMVLGSAGDFSSVERKAEGYRLGREFIGEFVKKFGTINCAELLKKSGSAYSDAPKPRTPEYYASRPCLRAVKYCAELLDKYIPRADAAKLSRK